MKNLKTLFAAILMLTITGMESAAQSISKDYIGTWSYQCADASYPYHEGKLIVSEKDQKPAVQVIFADGTSVNAQNASIRGEKLHFEISIEDAVVKTVLEKKDGKLAGTVESPEGNMSLTAQRKQPKG